MNDERYPIAEEVRARIDATLEEIERTEGVTIFYACESGSRAWGFPSADSDYDVRFLYAHPVDHYFSIDVEAKRDVIERPIDDELDVSGWDIRKALGLLYKSNPPLLEWLDSPIIYHEDPTIVPDLRLLLPTYYAPRRAFYHYLHMAQGNYRSYLKGDLVRTKKYFYVLRPLLAINWIEQRIEPVPMTFATLLDRLVGPGALRDAVLALLAAKQERMEDAYGPRIEPIDDYITSELARLEEVVEVPEKSVSIDGLNRFFRRVVGEIAER